mmetsp:Transcript_24926/g.47787  ORF Transcript_24926/g.47787 Transcript_24926/m.47787 type:complete len:234 (-) Transcript_24926:156-857(-)
MWALNYIIPAEPKHDDELYRLVNLKPWDWGGERKQYNDDLVLQLLRQNPGAARVKYKFRTTRRGTTKLYPLFRIISLGGSLTTIRTCRRAHPEALSVARTDVRGNALHTACSFRSDISVVKYIHRKDPTLVRETNKNRFTPLNLACAHGSSGEVVKFLVKQYPGALDIKNILGETPHAAAVNNGASEEILAALGSTFSSDGMSDTGNSSVSVSVPSLEPTPPDPHPGGATTSS